jgi:hypothetical protein
LFSPRPHIVFRYAIKLNGQLKQLNITTLRLSGCEVKLLGHNLFSYCGLLGTEDTHSCFASGVHFLTEKS